MKKSFIAMAVVVMALVFGGCAKVPQVELDATNAAIERAKVAEANVYLQPAFTAIMDSLNVINAEIEANKGKLFKNFNDVKVKLAALEVQANELVVSTDAKKESIKQEVNAVLAELQALAIENAALVENAPKGKEGKAAIEAIKGELTVIDGATAEVTQLLQAGKLLAAQSKAKATYDKALSINQELKAVVEKYNTKRK
ncbi:MAG: hypothetical protein CVT99_00530 [Bacteroidetes bacterium HGW-Bacteroidetes-16]|jgi:hypothetical protein|nr:MAG: hypothetical protein CVT99_00530 [Bacteroidetes bacterium HGW-Bacteroidetes-16]